MHVRGALGIGSAGLTEETLPHRGTTPRGLWGDSRDRWPFRECRWTCVGRGDKMRGWLSAVVGSGQA